MGINDILIAPFADYAFMRRALVACLILSISGAPVGMFLNLRRMTLAGDAMSHAILPGVAVAFALWGIAVWPMTAAALAVGIFVAALAGVLTRVTQLREDSSVALVYLLSLAAGMAIISRAGSGVDLLHILFGNILAIDESALVLVAGTATLTWVALGQIYRGLVIECMDPEFLQAAAGGRRGWTGPVFFMLIVGNLVAAFQALGTLMALGLILLPAIAAPFWVRSLGRMMAVACGIAAAGSYLGLLASYHLGLPAGPGVVLATGILCVASVVFGAHGSLLRAYAEGRRAVL
ncbi:MAG: metal ABC transporter permease [Rhodospirillales bacterium]|nr:metal ABC transporter permease [Alphaproteobacteria bacterium]MCB9986839.1 metal ABC transporter permease [Rhodospirillales bacterium]USO08398.1 MAG: metal ABC transporter permease [Rhodospirillales bacterium]